MEYSSENEIGLTSSLFYPAITVVKRSLLYIAKHCYVSCFGGYILLILHFLSHLQSN